MMNVFLRSSKVKLSLLITAKVMENNCKGFAHLHRNVFKYNQRHSVRKRMTYQKINARNCSELLLYCIEL